MRDKSAQQTNLTDIESLEKHWQNGKNSTFTFCKLLHTIILKKKVKAELLKGFYAKFNISERQIQRLKKVGEVFSDYTSDHVVAYGISHLTRLAYLDSIGRYIIDSKISVTVEDLDIISINREVFHPFKYSNVEEFLRILDRIKTPPIEIVHASNECDVGKKILDIHCNRLVKKSEHIDESIRLIELAVRSLFSRAQHEEISVTELVGEGLDLVEFEKVIDDFISRLSGVKVKLLNKTKIHRDEEEDKGGISSARM